MSSEIKSGKVILDEFFKSIKSDDELDSETVEAIVDLYEINKFTDKNLTNKLSELRMESENGKNK